MKVLKIWWFIKSRKQFTSRSINRQIFSAALVVAVCTVLVKVIAFSKESIVAWKFGATSVVDALLIATIVPKFMVDVVAGSFNVALIPTYIRIQEQEGSTPALKLLCAANFWAIILLSITTLLITITAPLYLPWMTLGFSADQLALTLQLLYAIAPFVILSGFNALFSAVLNAGEQFAFAALIPIVTPAITIVLLVLFRSSLGIFALAIGLTMGTALEMGLLGFILYRRGIVLRPRLCGVSPALRQVAKQYIPAVLGTLLMNSTLLVDQSMAAALSPGSVAALNYANRVNSFPLALATTALSTAVVPYFSKMIASSNWQGVRHTLKTYLKLIFLVTVPLTGLLVMLSEPIVQLLFQRGAFTANETHLVAQILSAFALQMPFHIAAVFIVQVLVSMSLNYTLMWVCGFNLLINISCNYIFMQWIGIQGIALSTSFVHLFSFCYVYFFVNKNLNKLLRS
jgi:putative peptidoglycan lipid II flippase